jgi:hypothetical protein
MFHQDVGERAALIGERLPVRRPGLRLTGGPPGETRVDCGRQQVQTVRQVGVHPELPVEPEDLQQRLDPLHRPGLVEPYDLVEFVGLSAERP